MTHAVALVAPTLVEQFDPSGPSVADSGQKRTVAGPDNLNPDANQNERGKA